MTDVMAQPPQPFVSKWASRYRGVRITSHPPPPPPPPPRSPPPPPPPPPPAALSLTPADPVSLALQSAFERDYTHLTIVDGATRALLGYLSIPHLQRLLDSGRAAPGDAVRTAMVRFRRGGHGAFKYRVITMDTPLEELEAFFAGVETGGQTQDFAVITDDRRRFVLGVATVADLEEFVKRRPA
ncbi:hypothetical protein BT67DRAFT_425669 [Trichocladium antarcticum]|uniref:Cystathionine beta-synthase n=1 Tax=Trichocladium antarcticum TaxID=1450529 RepID=A0AAN6ZBM8_9PEZI|nr:hypothetical protein BT67DRAFT_425669 [Trichocladium antarcticum]